MTRLILTLYSANCKGMSLPHKYYEVGTLAVDGWAVTYGTARRALGGAAAMPLLTVPNVTAHTSTASVLITVLLYNGPLYCGFNVPIKALQLPVSNFSVCMSVS